MHKSTHVLGTTVSIEWEQETGDPTMQAAVFLGLGFTTEIKG